MAVLLRFASYHLGEAVDELCAAILSGSASNGSRSALELSSSQIAHALQHLNWYWNAVMESAAPHDQLDDELFLRFSEFPEMVLSSLDIESIQINGIAESPGGEASALLSESDVVSDPAINMLSAIRFITRELLHHSLAPIDSAVVRKDTKEMLRIYALIFLYWNKQTEVPAEDGVVAVRLKRRPCWIPQEFLVTVPISGGKKNEDANGK